MIQRRALTSVEVSRYIALGLQANGEVAEGECVSTRLVIKDGGRRTEMIVVMGPCAEVEEHDARERARSVACGEVWLNAEDVPPSGMSFPEEAQRGPWHPSSTPRVR